MGNIWSWETDIKAAEIEAAKDAKIAEMEARIAEINREIAEFDTGIHDTMHNFFSFYFTNLD